MSAATGTLKQQAVLAAKQGEWEVAVRINESILSQEPSDAGALNRLGTALIQLKDYSKAKSAFKAALELDRFNTIAKKNLEKLQHHDANHTPTFAKQHFIEEPGKTKIVDLHRLSGKQTLETVTAGSPCVFICKKRYISVEVGGVYVGALPEDVSFRLSKLMQTGNEYECFVRSVSNNSCSIYIREAFRSPQNQNISSFPVSRNSSVIVDDVDEMLLKEDRDFPSDEFETEEDTSTDERPSRSHSEID